MGQKRPESAREEYERRNEKYKKGKRQLEQEKKKVQSALTYIRNSSKTGVLLNDQDSRWRKGSLMVAEVGFESLLLALAGIVRSRYFCCESWTSLLTVLRIVMRNCTVVVTM